MNRKDLVVLAADKDMEYALKGLLSRPQALGIRKIEADIRVHPGHDPACAGRGVEYLSNFSEYYHYGLLLFDHEGSGREQIEPQALQETLNSDFGRSAWGERARAIVLSPELEVWVWSNSPHVEDVAGWKNRQPSLRSWMIDQGWLEEGEVKPGRPKEAFQAALREARIPRSASLYQRIAEKVSLRGCEDRAFLKFKDLLKDWFPRDSQY
ncbi:MAG: hypothetical protein OXH81_07440 [Gemmatimonadetes bacterium]|nr:hypothetical protein [Gemmatimonadota bacterium]MDE2737730.1 hypothetical protein [Gemmatimonadota bacterium]